MTSSDTQSQAKPKLSVLQHAISAWPMVLVIVGGAIGGLCGGVAWAINTKIMASGMSAPMRYGLCVLTGFLALGAWLLAVVALTAAFPDLFGQP